MHPVRNVIAASDATNGTHTVTADGVHCCIDFRSNGGVGIAACNSQSWDADGRDEVSVAEVLTEQVEVLRRTWARTAGTREAGGTGARGGVSRKPISYGCARGAELTCDCGDRAPRRTQLLRTEVELGRVHAVGVRARYDGFALSSTVLGAKCPRWDSNPHWMVFETIASAVGLPGQQPTSRPLCVRRSIYRCR